MNAAEALVNHYPILLEQPEYFNVSSWTGHIPFAMLAIALTTPRIFVELGTHYGVSYMAFCQAVKKLNTQTRCYAVDTWQGDAHAGRYNDYVLEQLKAAHNLRYDGFSTLLQMTFDQAVVQFQDGSIDLLHIDGCHTYEAVSHDFMIWLPKMSERGVILFHDTTTRLEDYGVWKFWEEIASKYPSFNFTHYYGLGVLAVGKNYPSELNTFFEASPTEQLPLRLLFYQLADQFHHDEMRARMEQTHAEVYFQHENKFVDYEQQIANLTSLLKQEQARSEEMRIQLTNSLQALTAENEKLIDSILHVKEGGSQQRLRRLRLDYQNQSNELPSLQGNRITYAYLQIRRFARQLMGKG
jgi:hypothetical protein